MSGTNVYFPRELIIMYSSLDILLLNGALSYPLSKEL